MTTIQKNKERICELLRSTGREGIEGVIAELEKGGFFTAPASCRHHLNNRGGLAEHSLKVYSAAKEIQSMIQRLRPEMSAKIYDDSIVLASLLHDVCKMEIYKEATVCKQVTHHDTVCERRFVIDNSEFPAGHGEKSVILLLMWGLKLTRDEILAIRWHMTAWDVAFQSIEQTKSLQKARETTPLCYVVQCADSLASGILESKIAV